MVFSIFFFYVYQKLEFIYYLCFLQLEKGAGGRKQQVKSERESPADTLED